MSEAISPSGDPVLIREWPKRSKVDEDLHDIWSHEVRQLHRLGGYPGAQQYIARMIEADSDAKGFYIAIDAGQRQPLEIVLRRGRGATEWLRNLGIANNRHRLWSNLRRIAKGLEILHTEGLVHRNLNSWAVLTSAGEDPDFQLTGFEWSLRLSATEDQRKSSRAPESDIVSFASDWASFATLSATIFNVSYDRLIDWAIPDYEVHQSASALEIRLMRDLLLPTDTYLPDGELVSGKIDQILRSLDAVRGGDDGYYHLVLRLQRESDLSTAVREASELEIETDDPDSQLAWITADIGKPVRLLRIGSDDNAQLAIRGRQLVYRLKQFRATDQMTWQFAFCETAEPADAWNKRVEAENELPAVAVKLLTNINARQSFQRVRGRSPSWQIFLASVAPLGMAAPTREIRLHRALTLLHALEIAFAAASIFRVNVQSDPTNPGSVFLEYVSSSDADELSRALGIAAPRVRLKDNLEEEKLEREGWVLTETARLGQAQGGDVELTFEEDASDAQISRFRFRVAGESAIVISSGFLVAGGLRGDFVQFRRRSKAIRLLREHTELLQALADPRRRLIATQDVVEEDTGYKELDDAKQKSLKELTSILPLYLLQGPPGVGKTFLVKDLVRRRLKDDKSTRLLVTAQGNHAIDHLLDELAESWKQSATPPLAVRCRPKEDRTAPGQYDLRDIAAGLTRALISKPIAKFTSPAVQARLRAMAGDVTALDATALASETRAVEGLVMRAANIVFATTNSADLERLVDENGQFDWAIVEEAGKATGLELITPLMLSHRRLMIGDHKQLPPFGAQEMEKLLNDTTAVRNSLRALPKLIHPTTRNLLDEELLEFIEDESLDLDGLCSEAKRILYLFETMLETELDRQKRKAGGKSIASTLEVQHRMHETICELVSKSFYSGKLTTSPERKSKPDVIQSANSTRVPEQPVVFIDMPFERASVGGGRKERTPRFTNDEEIAKVVEVLRELRVSSTAEKVPSLVILTPYARQMRRLKEAVLADANATAALKAFKPKARGGEWFSTVDAFQGNEADVVIFSLVRNNRQATIRRALGFVGDRRRFNVLLSRARQKMIFVGSLDFLRGLSEPLGLESDPASDFLRVFLKTLDDQIASNRAGYIKVAHKGSAA